MLDRFLKDFGYTSAAQFAKESGINKNTLSKLRNADKKTLERNQIGIFLKIKRAVPEADLTEYWPILKELL